MEIQNLLKDISKRAGSAGSNQTLREACDVALVHLSSAATAYAYPYAEVLKAFCLATQSPTDRIAAGGLDGLGHVVATAPLASLLEVCFVLSWTGEPTGKGAFGNSPAAAGANGGGERGGVGVGGGGIRGGGGDHNVSGNPHLAGIDDSAYDAASSSSLSADVHLPAHLARAFFHTLMTRPRNDASSRLKAIQLLLGAAAKSLQLLPAGDLLFTAIFNPLLHLHSTHQAMVATGLSGSGGGSSSSATVGLVARYSYQLLSVVVTEMVLGRFLADAVPLDWEFFEPFTCAAATVGTLEECAPDDLYEPISIPARCRPFYSDPVNGGFSLREPHSMTINFPPSFGQLREMLLSLCRRAAATVPIGLPEEAKAEAVARRGCALRLLIDLFTAMPTANANDEHPSASWLALALEPHQLLPCISKNLATTRGAFFDEAVHLFALISLKAHFHMGAELMGYLSGVLIPLALSQLSSYSQKVAIVRCIRNAFLSQPRALISVFINYDCSLDVMDRRRGVPTGVLSTIIPFITTLMFTQFSLVSPDQTLLLRQECVESIAVFVRSLLTWAAAEVPEAEAGGGTYLDPKKAPLAYHWKHIHLLHHNKALLQASRAVNMEGGVKKWLEFATEHGFFSSLHPAAIAKFLHHEAPQAVGDEVKHSLANALLKAPLHEAVMAELLALRTMRGLPLDIAFRDFVCDVLHPEGMPADKQLPESQAWGRLQTLFGAEYSKQNADADVRLTPYAADALAGSILFLHSATHNANSVMRFTAHDWMEKTVESMGVPVGRSYLEPIYLRTVAAPWGTLQTIMGSQLGGGGAKGKSGGGGGGGGVVGGGSNSGSAGGGDNSGGGVGGGIGGGKAASVRIGLNYHNDDLTETESNSKTKHDALSCGKARELCTEYHQWLSRLSYNFYRQPYITPFYAMHVRPILLNYLPNVVVCLHLGALSLTRMPTLTLLSDCFGDINELTGALALSLRDLREPAKELADSLFARPNAVPPEPFTLATMPLLCVDL